MRNQSCPRNEEAIGCNITCSDDCEDHKFSINQCESHGKSDLDRISEFSFKGHEETKIPGRQGSRNFNN